MPIITIQITDEEVTSEQKAQLIKQSTEMMKSILNKEPATTFVIIEEVELGNWGIGGLPVAIYRKNISNNQLTK